MKKSQERITVVSILVLLSALLIGFYLGEANQPEPDFEQGEKADAADPANTNMRFSPEELLNQPQGQSGNALGGPGFGPAASEPDDSKEPGNASGNGASKKATTDDPSQEATVSQIRGGDPR